ncbi:hypothetical protein ES288_A07G107700v1 [Gossypium darwinii]|uniref:Uncharacterized protein n=2 Tax=Gossypium TaxID=3633 RepID=A0A5D2PU42_GOSTO|nr:hypothetical protein ES288_A07G107700v1 [Gossypium darwinii]TYI18654.1 hypothetical protein ES332_A07G107300v1 [Gossypium tomentosum]
MLNSHSVLSPLNSHSFPCEVKINEEALEPSSSPLVHRVIKKESRNIGMGKFGTSRTKWWWQRRRKIFSACESRSRQPVKHYKKLLSEIFPKSPNTVRNISSLKML